MERIKNSYPDETESLNKVMPCPFLTEEELCLAHDIKPVDCRLFPFDLIIDGGKFFWIIREIDCLILKDEEIFEEYLKDFERNLIPGFSPYMEDYALFRFDELAGKYGFRILREVQFKEEI